MQTPVPGNCPICTDINTLLRQLGRDAPFQPGSPDAARPGEPGNTASASRAKSGVRGSTRSPDSNRANGIAQVIGTGRGFHPGYRLTHEEAEEAKP